MKMETNTIFKEIETIYGDRPIIIGPVKGRFLADTILKAEARKVLEIGTYVGYSAILMAKVLPGDGKVITLERDVKSAARALFNIQKTNSRNKIEIRIGDAELLIPGIQEEFDMIFIDADKSRYLNYLKLGEKKLKKGGIVFADNVKIAVSDLHEYLDYVRNSGGYKSQYIDVGNDGIEISEKLF